MVARFLTFGLLALGILHNPFAQRVPPYPLHTLLAPVPLTDEITLTVGEYSDPGVSLSIQVELQNPPGAPKGQSLATTQVWLLRRDGAAIAQRWQPSNTTFWSRIQDTTFGVAFFFPRVPTTELAGVVVSVNGKLYVREIVATSAR